MSHVFYYFGDSLKTKWGFRFMGENNGLTKHTCSGKQCCNGEDLTGSTSVSTASKAKQLVSEVQSVNCNKGKCEESLATRDNY
ncbi:hypothetical protein DPMN_185425 [Dreissena polymorpha]|uniref:Uncharacterized protein n=1 Tax=Dreissena polymorpha TaxID=45954 RepID=A0A9D4DNK1_DREPO|nr:hypothetical protein DPMN_185425 [Dreissena polymorpha]